MVIVPAPMGPISRTSKGCVMLTGQRENWCKIYGGDLARARKGENKVWEEGATTYDQR